MPGDATDGLSQNAYLYTGNNAVNYVDGSGMSFDDDVVHSLTGARVSSIAVPTAVTGAVSAHGGVIEFAAKKLPKEKKALALPFGPYNIPIGETYVTKTGNILIQKVAAVGVVSLALALCSGIENVKNYGWREDLGRTGFDLAGILASASIGAFVAGLSVRHLCLLPLQQWAV